MIKVVVGVVSKRHREGQSNCLDITDTSMVIIDKILWIIVRLSIEMDRQFKVYENRMVDKHTLHYNFITCFQKILVYQTHDYIDNQYQSSSNLKYMTALPHTFVP